METKKVIPMGLNKFPNLGHLGFSVEIEKFLTEAGAENISCVDLLPLYSSALAAEADVVKRQRGSSITAELEQKDVERDDILKYIFNILDAAKYAPMAEAKEAHRVLLPVLKPYRGLPNYPNLEESGGIIALLIDLRAKHHAAHVTVLGLTSALDLLDSKNDEYIELDKQRIKEAPSKVVTDAIRAKADAIYHQMIDRINATVILSPNTTAEALVDNLNKYIEQTNAIYNQRMGQLNRKDSTCEEVPSETCINENCEEHGTPETGV